MIKRYMMVFLGAGSVLSANCSATAVSETAETVHGRIVVPVQARTAAIDAIDRLRYLSKDTRAKSLAGTTEDLALAALGDPLPVAHLDLDRLAHFKGVGPAELLVDEHRILYPLKLSSGVSPSSVSVMLSSEGKWRIAGVGYSNLTGLVDRTMTDLSRSGAREFSMIEVPLIHIRFVGYYEGRVLMVAPLRTDPSLGFSQGVPMDAGLAFSKIAPLTEKKLRAKSAGDP